MRSGDRLRQAVVAAGVLAAVILVALAVPRIPSAWSLAWNTWDFVSGGVEDRHRLLRDNPFPAELAPPGYRIDGNEEHCDPEECLGWAVSFAGPDDLDTITFYPHAMTASEVYDYWRRGSEFFGIHWDIVKDLRFNGRIELDGKVVQENGVWVA